MQKLLQSINQFHDKVSLRVDTHQESGTCGQTDWATITTAVLLYMTIIELVDCMLLNFKVF